MSKERDEVQIPFIKRLVNSYPYTTLVPMAEIENFEKQNIIVNQLRNNDQFNPFLDKKIKLILKRLNTWLEEDQINDCLRQLKYVKGASLIEKNKRTWEILRESSLTQMFGDKARSVNFIDFLNVENNEWLLVPEFIIGSKRLDLVVFLNGIPIIPKEDKSPSKNIEDALVDLQDYVDIQGLGTGIQKFFNSTLFMVASNGDHCLYGSITGFFEHFTTWRTKDKQIVGTQQDTLADDLMNPTVLLDIIKNFHLFDFECQNVIIPKHYQYYGVNAVIEDLQFSKSPGGVMDKTQGSGKSFDMTFLANKIRRSSHLNKYKQIYMNDRNELDEQLIKEYLVKYLGNGSEKGLIKRTKTVKDFRKALQGDSSEIITAIMQKSKDLPRNNSQNILVYVDEGHRTQGGLLGAELDKALPNAKWYAFTGTPVDKTKEIFNKTIYRYTYNDALTDKVVLPIVYEGREVKLDPQKALLDLKEKSFFKNLDPVIKSKLYEKYVGLSTIMSSDARINFIAMDIYNDYITNVDYDKYKGMLATNSIEEGLKYYKELKELFQLNDISKNWRVELLFSKSNRKRDSKINENFTNPRTHTQLREEFKKNNNFKIIIVVDMLMTGYDPKICQVLYNDKTVGEESPHSIFQRVTRTNRIFGDKPFGRVVDYANIYPTLQSAITLYGEEGNKNPILDIAKVENDLIESIKNLQEFIDNNKPLTLHKDCNFEKFRSLYRETCKLFEFLLPRKEALVYKKDYLHFKDLYERALSRRNSDGPAEDFIKAKLAYKDRIKEVVQNGVNVLRIETLINGVDIFSKDFKKTLNNPENTAETKALILANSVKSHAKNIRNKDPEKSKKLSQLVTEIITKYELDWTKAVTQLEKLVGDEIEQTSEEVKYNIPSIEKECFSSYKKLSDDMGVSLDKLMLLYNPIKEEMREAIDSIPEVERNLSEQDKIFNLMSSKIKKNLGEDEIEKNGGWAKVKQDLKIALKNMFFSLLDKNEDN